ncbi:MAG: hypothetical protein AB7P69_09930 [Candidatus Binatia bacterium]
MQEYTLISFGIVCFLVGLGVCVYVYRLGVRRGRSAVVPFPLYNELLDHRIDCLGQDPRKARVEVETMLNAAVWEA